VNTENFITKGDSLQASSLPILSRFSGALETPNFIEGAPTTLVDEDFADISEWTVESGAPTVGPATWDPSINSLKATQDASNTAQRLSRLVAGNPSFSLEADIFVPFGAGTGVDTVNIIQVQSRDPSPTAFVSLTLIVRNGSPSLRVTWRVGPNTGATSQEFAMSVGVPLSVRVEHQQGDVAGTSSFAVFIDGVNELFLDDVDILVEGQIILTGGQLLLILGGAGTVIVSLFGLLMKANTQLVTVVNNQSEKWAARDAENARIMADVAVSNNNTAAAMQALATELNRNA